MSTTNDIPEWEFYLTTDQAKSLSHAGITLLTGWQKSTSPSPAQLKMQRQLASALEHFNPQLNDILYSEPS
jgi:hypothetical protein